MEDYIIIAIVVLVIAAGISSTVRRFVNKKSCCSSGEYKPKRKKLSHVKYTKVFSVEGMHCEHCKGRVEEIINDIKGLAGKADLKKGELIVLYAEEVSDDVIIERIEKAGYKIISQR